MSELKPELKAESKGVRPRVADAIGEAFDVEFLRNLAEDVKTAVKGQWVDVKCEECGKRQRVLAEVRDFPKIVSMVTGLLEQVEGKPGTAGVEDAGVSIVVERKWPT